MTLATTQSLRFDSCGEKYQTVCLPSNLGEAKFNLGTSMTSDKMVTLYITAYVNSMNN